MHALLLLALLAVSWAGKDAYTTLRRRPLGKSVKPYISVSTQVRPPSPEDDEIESGGDRPTVTNTERPPTQFARRTVASTGVVLLAAIIATKMGMVYPAVTMAILVSMMAMYRRRSPPLLPIKQTKID